MSQKFQDLEEERLDFTKSSLWTYANIASTVCVSDDAVSWYLSPLLRNANLRLVLREDSIVSRELRGRKRYRLLH